VGGFEGLAPSVSPNTTIVATASTEATIRRLSILATPAETGGASAIARRGMY
jgi:hypothetical protein